MVEGWRGRSSSEDDEGVYGGVICAVLFVAGKREIGKILFGYSSCYCDHLLIYTTSSRSLSLPNVFQSSSNNSYLKEEQEDSKEENGQRRKNEIKNYGQKQLCFL